MAEIQRVERVYLVGCGKSKLDLPPGRTAPARDLYMGALFRKSLELVEAYNAAQGGVAAVRILSAEHGLVDPDQPLEPYDLALTELSAEARREWGTGVAFALQEVLSDDSRRGLVEAEFQVFAGRAYAEALTHGLMVVARAVPRVRQPLAGLGMGERLAWLNGRLTRLAEAAAIAVEEATARTAP